MAGLLRHLRQNIRLVSSFGKSHTKGAYSQKRHIASTTKTLYDWRAADEYVEISHGDAVMRFDYVWLRDTCRSAASYNPKTSQRILDTASIDLNIRPAQTKVTDGHLSLTWPDGHVTSYSLSWLAEHSHQAKTRTVLQNRVLWNRDTYDAAQVPSARWEEFMSSEAELRSFVQNFLLYGIAFVDGVPASVEATEAVSERVSIIRETLYGRMWSFTSDLSRGDTAYTTQALDRHTDTTYLHEPCGVQVFHCLQHDGAGGRTLLVDGFHAAHKVLEESPESFQVLCRVPIRHENIEAEGGHRNHLVGTGPVLSAHPWNRELYMIRYNNYDRAPIDTAPPEAVRRWYAAHRLLTARLRDPGNELWVKLTPGRVVFIDNWRVLHGRDSFTGLRRVCGCYLPRDDLLSTARALGLLA